MDEFPWPESCNQKAHAGKLGLGCRQPGPHKHVVISTAEPAQRGHGGPGRSDTFPGDGRLNIAVVSLAAKHGLLGVRASALAAVCKQLYALL